MASTEADPSTNDDATTTANNNDDDNNEANENESSSDESDSPQQESSTSAAPQDATVAASAPSVTSGGLFDSGSSSSDDDEDDSDQERANSGSAVGGDPAAPVTAPVTYVDKDVVIPYADRPEDEAANREKFEMLIAHMPASVDVVTEPFAADQYDEAAEHDELIAKNKLFAVHSLIRHRIDDRTGAVESNARLVEYSDGSRVLFVGKEPFRAPMPNATKHSYVALNRRATYDDGTTSLAFEFQGHLAHQLQLKPFKNSAINTLMALQLKRQAIESDKTGESYTTKAENMRRVVDVRAGRSAARRRGGGGGRRRPRGALNKGFLEQGAEDISDEGESSIARLKRRAKQRGKRAGRGRAASSSEESEAVSTSSSEEEADLPPRRKRPPPRARGEAEPKAAPTSSNGGNDDDDDDDDDSEPQAKITRTTKKAIDSESESD